MIEDLTAPDTLILTRSISRFYPGLSQPRFAAIGSGLAQSSAAIDAPEGEEFTAGASFDSGHEEPHEQTRRKVSHRPNSNRATRVVGSLEHPILPVPPVRILS